MSFMTMLSNKFSLVDRAAALPGRDTAIMTPGRHAVTGVPIDLAPGDGQEEVLLGLGCFWGAERLFWQLPGVAVTAVGYAGGPTPEPDLQRGLYRAHRPHRSGARGLRHQCDFPMKTCWRAFWEGHDPTQGMRQGNDTGTQYRSAIYYTTDEMKQAAEATAAAYTEALRAAGPCARDHHGNQADGGLLLRGRAAPAVSRQESRRILRPWRHRRRLSGPRARRLRPACR
jgi:peptide-methionine (S)-S-oxide reductase